MEIMIRSMNKCNISEYLIKNIGTAPPTLAGPATNTSPTLPQDKSARAAKMRNKYDRLTKNRKAIDKVLKSLNIHIAYLKSMCFYDIMNFNIKYCPIHLSL